VTNDNSKHKALMGALWQKTSKGAGIYLMAMAKDAHPKGWTVDEQIKHAIH